MLQSSSLLADALADRLIKTFTRTYGRTAQPSAEVLGEAARLVIERLSLSDALYHTAEHTVLVTLVAQDILPDDSADRVNAPQDQPLVGVGHINREYAV